MKGYRSVDDWIHIELPGGAPLVLLGENNAGKSNILRALSFLFGDYWPGNHRPEDHEFFGRTPEGNEIKIGASLEGVPCDRGCGGSVRQIYWTHAPDDDPPTQFRCRTEGCGHSAPNNQIRNAVYCMSVGVNRDLSYQLSYSSKWTTLSKLMRRFHDQLVGDPGRVARLEAIFESLVSTFGEVTEFSQFSDSIRSSFADFGGGLQYGLEIDFSAYDPSNYFRSLRLFPHVGGTPRTYEELGTGQEQILAMAFAHAFADAFGGEGLLLAIEEPESHLHPLAQQWLARKLRQLATSGVQVVVTTHSPYFVDLTQPWTTVVVRKDSESAGTRVTQLNKSDLTTRLVELGAPPELVQPDSVGQFYDAASTYETLSALFARAVIVVEGSTEHLAIPEWLDRVGLDLVHLGIAVVPVSGLTSMAKWVRLYRAYGLPVFALFDTDSNKSPIEVDRALHAGREVLHALGTPGDPASTPGELTVSAGYATFDSNYEAAFRAMFGDRYIELEAEAREVVGRSKQLKARYCARKLERTTAPLAWSRLEQLADALRATFPETSHQAMMPTGAVPPERAGISRPAPPRRT